MLFRHLAAKLLPSRSGLVDGSAKPFHQPMETPGSDVVAGLFRAARVSERRDNKHHVELPLTVSPLETVRRFHALAQGVRDYTPPQGSREVAQAEKLLKAHGMDKVNFIINHTVRSAKRTKFRMQTFGAVDQYVGQALEAYEYIKKDAEEATHIEGERQEANPREAEAYKGAEKLLRELPAGEWQALHDEVKSDLVMKCSRVNSWKPELSEAEVKAQMATRLRQRTEATLS